MCFGFAAAFSLTVGNGCEGGGVPRRSRAFALTAVVAEKTFFLDLDGDFGMVVAGSLWGTGYSEPRPAWKVLCGAVKAYSG